jgi:hypothetical protein
MDKYCLQRPRQIRLSHPPILYQSGIAIRFTEANCGLGLSRENMHMRRSMIVWPDYKFQAIDPEHGRHAKY